MAEQVCNCLDVHARLQPRDRSRMPQRMNARTLDTRRLRKLGNVDAHVFHDNYPTQSQANRGSKVWEGPQS
jgi:hypothetical protein